MISLTMIMVVGLEGFFHSVDQVLPSSAGRARLATAFFDYLNPLFHGADNIALATQIL